MKQFIAFALIEVLESPPVRGRGLKLVKKLVIAGCFDVAPRAGAWIETEWEEEKKNLKPCRPPCGGVD